MYVETIKIKNGESLIDYHIFCCDGCESGGELNAHHIKNYSEHKIFRYSIDNGITFCEQCHKEFHKEYGRTKNNLDQVLKFKMGGGGNGRRTKDTRGIHSSIQKDH